MNIPVSVYIDKIDIFVPCFYLISLAISSTETLFSKFEFLCACYPSFKYKSVLRKHCHSNTSMDIFN